MSNKMTDIQSQRTLRDCVCSGCWGHLLRFAEPGGIYRVECHRCKGDTVGFVTRDYAERRRLESVSERVEVEKLLQTIGAMPKSPKKTKTQLMKELGF